MAMTECELVWAYGNSGGCNPTGKTFASDRKKDQGQGERQEKASMAVQA